jgi:putative transposase
MVSVPRVQGDQWLSMTCAATILSGIEMVHMMRKGQAGHTFTAAPSVAEQFEILAA